MERYICVLGDICPTPDYAVMFSKGKVLSEEVQNLLKKSECVVANLECPATSNDKPITKCGPILKASISDLSAVKKMGITAVSLANNHILDYGTQGLIDTLKACSREGLVSFGGGINVDNAAKPYIMSFAEKRIGFISFAEAEFNLAGENTPGANHFDPYEAYNTVYKLHNECDFLIVLYHGGIEHYRYPSPLLQKKCRKFIENGAQLVLCQHSHCIGTSEDYLDGKIVYGQGNTIFGFRDGSNMWNEGLVVIINESLQVSFRVLAAQRNCVDFADNDSEIKRLEDMKSDSERLKDKQSLQTSWSEFVEKEASRDMPLVYGWGRIRIKVNRLLHGKLFDLTMPKTKLRTTMNYIRCESWHEVIQTILENKVLK